MAQFERYKSQKQHQPATGKNSVLSLLEEQGATANHKVYPSYDDKMFSENDRFMSDDEKDYYFVGKSVNKSV